MGTPEFANPSLSKLHQSSHQVVAVVTGIDKPIGRARQGKGRKIESPPVKCLAEELGYPVLQPASLKDESFQSHLVDMAADLFVVVAFRILPDALLSIPPRGAVNLHPSLLPRYRGAAPIHHCLLRGDTITGVTTIALTSDIDAGGILLQKEYPVEPEDDLGSLSSKLSDYGAELLLETINGMEQGTLTPRPQSEFGTGEVLKAPKIKPEDLVIDWDRPARDITNQIRAFSPKPGAVTFFKGRRMKLFRATIIKGEGEPGMVLGVSREQLHVATRNGAVVVAEVQIEGRQRMTVEEFIRGTPLEAGMILGHNPGELQQP